MASITIRNIDDGLKRKLRIRAAHRGHSMEDEVRDILKSALADPQLEVAGGLGTEIHQRFMSLGGLELELPVREAGREPPEFDER